MSISDATCWTVIRGAAAGRQRDREEFARRYERVIRAYLGARWRGSPLTTEIDDAAQEVFLDCFREGGALTRANPDWPNGFRAFLYGVVKNVARRVEHDRAHHGAPLESGLDPPARDKTLSTAFDRAWAKALLQQAAKLQAARAREAGDEAVRRVELLRLRFQDDLPIREIAGRWQADPSHVHHEYARARKEFREALHAVVEEHHAGTHGEIDRECARLIAHFK
jgi:RNA polymerase sigma-70 factor (ECF subfamily)